MALGPELAASGPGWILSTAHSMGTMGTAELLLVEAEKAGRGLSVFITFPVVEMISSWQYLVTTFFILFGIHTK